MNQLAQLARPVPKKYIKTLQGRGNPEYVAHSTITEILLMVVGPFDFQVSEIVRDKDGAVTGCLATLVCDIDGRTTTITEVGDTTGVETDEGSALKNAASDALKRCAMRVGVALHLWARDGYFLFDQLTKAEGGGASSDAPVSAGTDHSPEIETGVCPECGRDQLPLAERGGHSPRCSRRTM